MEHLIILLSKAFKCQFVNKSNIVYSFLIYVISEYNHLNFFFRQKVAYKSPYLPYSSSSSRLFATFSVVFVCCGIRSYLLDLQSKHENASYIYSCRTVTEPLQEILDRQTVELQFNPYQKLYFIIHVQCTKNCTWFLTYMYWSFIGYQKNFWDIFTLHVITLIASKYLLTLTSPLTWYRGLFTGKNASPSSWTWISHRGTVMLLQNLLWFVYSMF